VTIDTPRSAITQRWEAQRRRRVAVTISLCGLAACVTVAAVAPGPRFFEPLTLLLAATALVASLAYVDVEGTLLTDSSFVPFMLAAAFVGPAAVLAVAISTEVATWAMYRYRREAVLVNALATGGPLLVASGLLSLLSDRSGPAFYLLLAGAGALELVLNAFLVVSLIGLIDGRTIKQSVGGWRKIVAPFLFNILLAVAAANVYTNLGALAVVVVLAIIVSFRYLVARVFEARSEAERAAVLAQGRRSLVVQTLNAEDREKRRLADALHDGPLQYLFSAGQDLEEASGGDLRGLDRATGAVQAALTELRSIVLELHPTVLHQGGLAGAIQALAQDQEARARFRATVHCDPAAVGQHDRLVFSITRELLLNAARHAQASTVRLAVQRLPTEVVVTCQDDGLGFTSAMRESALMRGHVGLASLEERVDGVGGHLVVESTPGVGTTVIARLPLVQP
jgi:signal transduction histidine kinase